MMMMPTSSWPRNAHDFPQPAVRLRGGLWRGHSRLRALIWASVVAASANNLVSMAATSGSVSD